MELTNSLILIFLEVTFVFVSVLVLYGQRKNIGDAPFYVLLGLLLIFGQLLNGADLRFSALELGGIAFQFDIAPVVIFMPYLATILLVYITEGALATQRLIIGSLVVMGVFFYLGDLTRLQARWLSFTAGGELPIDAMDQLLERARRSMLTVVCSQMVGAFLLPVVFTRLRNAGHKLFVCCFGALGIALVADCLLWLVFSGIGAPFWWNMFYPMLMVKAVVVCWLSVLLALYVSKFGSEREAKHNRPLEILFTFLGSYGRSKLLEANLLESEGRYRMILENASEMILMLDHDCRILEANHSAELMLHESNLIGRNFANWLQPKDADALFNIFLLPVASAMQPAAPRRLLAKVSGREEGAREVNLALTVTPLAIGRLETFIVLGRDVTEELHLEEERQRLNEELAHSQRLEALGQLAGGVAHDFNNNIHALLGHADLIALNCDLDENAQRHLDKIVEIAEQSGQLTSQLLGFARKGKYRESNFDLRILVQKTSEIFMPGCKDIELDVDIAEEPLLILGDQVQLQQVTLNLLINARDALRNVTGRERFIRVILDRADRLPTLSEASWIAMKEMRPEHTAVLVIADNGCGMDEPTLKRLFEPFFTTKPVGQGTGMALAMAYGTISNHHGVIHVESLPGVGTTFVIALPLLME